jgi:hypothetical protein
MRHKRCSVVRPVLKKIASDHNHRRKNDEDIAERITGGVRVERPAVRREDQHRTSKDDTPADAGNGQSRGRRRAD